MIAKNAMFTTFASVFTHTLILHYPKSFSRLVGKV